MNPEQVTDKMLQVESTQEVQEEQFVNHYMVDDDKIEYTIFTDNRNRTIVLNTSLEH